MFTRRWIKCQNSFLILTRSLSYGTHYDVLQLQKNCSQKDIRRAFIELSKKHHPDKKTGKESHDDFVKILDAYKILSNPDRRASYDLGLTTDYPYSGGFNSAPRRKTNIVYQRDDYYYYYGDQSKKAYDFDLGRERPYNKGPRRYVAGIFSLFAVTVLAIYVTTIWNIMNSNTYRKWNRYDGVLHGVKNNRTDDRRGAIDFVIRRPVKGDD